MSGLPNITCESMVVHVPEEIAPTASVAATRAGLFATLALWIGTPAIEACEPVPGGFRVTVREGSPSTSKAKRAKA